MLFVDPVGLIARALLIAAGHVVATRAPDIAPNISLLVDRNGFAFITFAAQTSARASQVDAPEEIAATIEGPHKQLGNGGAHAKA